MRLVSLVIIGLVLSACTTSASSGGKLTVTAAFYPLAFVAERIGGTAVNVTNLTPPGAEPHDLELKPSDVRLIRGARVVLYLRGLQPAVDDAVDAFNERAAFDVLGAVDVLRSSDGSIDPHFWLDPVRLSAVAVSIEQRLESASPQNASAFKENLQMLRSELKALDTEFQAGLSRCERREIFTSHAAFAYLASRYGLNQVAITGLDPEAEPSPQRLTQIIQRARRAHPSVIFSEALIGTRSVEVVARAVGATVRVLNPLEGLLPEQERAGEDYFSLMREDLRQLEEAMVCATSP